MKGIGGFVKSIVKGFFIHGNLIFKRKNRIVTNSINVTNCVTR